MSQATITFIGAGNMASALIGGLVQQGYAPQQLCATDLNQELLRSQSETFGIRTSTDNQAAVQDADIVILAVKPQVMKAVLTELAPALQQRQPLLISIAAGINCESIARWSGGNLPVVRCMPNTPALTQTGASGLFATQAVSDDQRQQAEQILSAVGIALWVEQEKELDAVTAVSGSGPAYYFLLMEAMIDAGEKLGLSRSVAEQLTVQTALGAAKMAQASDVDVAELRRRVTSPGGTTEQALNRFEEGGLRALVDQALSAADHRSTELAEQLGR